MRASGVTGRSGAIAGRTIGAGATPPRNGAIAGRTIGTRNALWKGAVRPPSKGPAWAEVSIDATNPHAARMTSMLAAIRMVIALVLSALSTDPLYSASFAGSSALTSGL